MIEVCVTNLGKYNEGDLVYEQVTLPTTPEIMENALKNIGVGGEYEEYFLSDSWCDEISGVSDFIGEYSNLEELNYLASLLEKLNEDEVKTFESILEMEEPTIAGAINSLINMDDYVLYDDIENDYDIGYVHVHDSGIYDTSVLGYLSNFIDYESLGVVLRNGEQGMFTNHGYFVVNDHSPEVYTERSDIPDEYKLFSQVDNGSYLRTVELDAEEGYSFIDGTRNNLPPVKGKKEEEQSLIDTLSKAKKEVAKEEKSTDAKTKNKDRSTER